MVEENPYLAHYNNKASKKEKKAVDAGENAPLFGFLPRKVKGEQVRKAMVSVQCIVRVDTHFCAGTRVESLYKCSSHSPVQKDS